MDNQKPDHVVILPGSSHDYRFRKKNLNVGETVIVDGKSIHNDGRPEPVYTIDHDDICECELCYDPLFPAS